MFKNNEKRCKVIAVANEKGGVGKTTTIVNTASAMVKEGKKVLVIDFDPQCNLTVSLGFTEPENLDLTLKDFISDYTQNKELDVEKLKKCIISANGIDLMPANYKLMNYEYILKSMLNSEYALSDIIQPLLNDYDYIFIDCMSSTGVFTVNALVSADSVIIPTQSHFLSTNGLQLMLFSIANIKKRLNPKLKIEGVLVTMAQMRTQSFRKTVVGLRKDYKDIIKVFKTVIPHAIAVADAPSEGRSIIDIDAESAGSIAYQRFAKELMADGNR